MKIRKGKVNDLVELHSKFKYSKGISIYSCNSNYLYVVEQNGQIVAYLYGDKLESSRTGILLSIEVLEEYRKRKIATNLINNFESDLKKSNCNSILVFYNNDNGQQEFYEKVGFDKKDTLFAGLKEI